MKLFRKMKDGGEESRVWGYWLIEIKSLFSIVLLRFEHGTREAYHNHAFNCFSWVLSGCLLEWIRDNNTPIIRQSSLVPFLTFRDTFHKVESLGRSWVLSFRGPWSKTWKEEIDGQEITLTHGREVLKCSSATLD